MSRNSGFFSGSRLVQAPPARTVPQCGACGLLNLCETPKMKVAGRGARGVLFVGAAPGGAEDTAGRPFVGEAGERLRRVLHNVKFDLDEDGWATNAIICRPPKDRSPTNNEIGYCRPNLARAIRELQPTVIVLLGGSAVAGALGADWREDTGPIGRWVGWRVPHQGFNAWVCPTWHPSTLIREEDPVLDRQFQAHLRAAVRYNECPWPAGRPGWTNDVQHILDPDKAAKRLRQIAQRTEGAVAWDYETNMLKPDDERARVVSCAVAWGRKEPEECIAYPWAGAAVAATGELLRAPIKKIASNLKFEDRWTRAVFGHRVRGWVWDTMLAAHVLDNRPGITSVKFQAFVRLGVPVWNNKIEPFLKTKGDETVNRIYREIDIKDLLTYNGLDALLEFRVAVDQIRELGLPLPWRA